MSERIDAIRRIVKESSNHDDPYGVAYEDVTHLFAHIDALTRERDELKAANGVLRETCEGASRACAKLGAEGTMPYNLSLIASGIAGLLQPALAATASGKGE